MRGPLERKTEVRSVDRTAYTVAHLCEQLTGTLGTRAPAERITVAPGSAEERMCIISLL